MCKCHSKNRRAKQTYNVEGGNLALLKSLQFRETLYTILCAVFLIDAAFFKIFHSSSALAWQIPAIISTFFGGIEAAKEGLEALKVKNLDVHVLMLLAAIGAFAIGDFIESAGLLFLFSLSGTLESFAMTKTRSAISALVKLRPSSAILLTDGVEQVVPISELKSGETIRIPPYSGIPTDGVILDGQSSLDQSAITGESRSIPVGRGSKVLAGTQNLDGLLLVEITAAVGDTTLDKIMDLVQEAQENKASGEKVSEWFGQRFTLLVLASFAVSFFIRLGLHESLAYSLYGALTLLVAMSPCALVISTPATTLSALAWAARRGILIRGGEFIERAGLVNVVALDKTGTLTSGKPVLKKVCVCHDKVLAGGCHSEPDSPCWMGSPSMSAEASEILRAAAALEQYANHPIALAVLAETTSQNLVVQEVTDVKVLPGRGMVGTISGIQVAVGNEGLLFENGLSIPPTMKSRILEMQNDGLTASFVTIGEEVSAFGFEDEPRPEAKTLVDSLHKLGIKKVAMLSGDNLPTAISVGNRVGVDEVRGGMMPSDKSDYIQELSRTGQVMMVGDGVNDAPSLAVASVGVAMGGLGNDVALDAADVVLMGDRLELIPALIKLGRRTRSIVRGNLLFAAGVIVVLTVASLVTRLPLMLAVIGHEGSTIVVILSGLRLLNGPGRL